MKIYTKKGDKGTTTLFGGMSLKKDDVRIEAYGTVDELNSTLGLLCVKLEGLNEQRELLGVIQMELFDVGAQLATAPTKRAKFKLPYPSENEVQILEQMMDKMNESLPELKTFVMPGGNEAAAICHIARTICRRAERRIVTLINLEDKNSDGIIEALVVYMNRLSDYFFVLSRFICMKSGVEEILWVSDRKKKY